ncbi:hypothetical protein [Paraburkholderia fungorum]|uniref:hypothetical protein n=1 Tax=Paraburkholderia fungorum TaxID=134537 RepID=UPI0038BB0C7B
MATSILTWRDLPEHFTAEHLAACGLSEQDGLPVDETGGISLVRFLRFLHFTVKPDLRALLASDNPELV